MAGLVLSSWSGTCRKNPGKPRMTTTSGSSECSPLSPSWASQGAAYFFLVVIVPLSSKILHARLLHSVMDAPVAFFSRTDVGVITNRFSQDIVGSRLRAALRHLWIS